MKFFLFLALLTLSLSLEADFISFKVNVDESTPIYRTVVKEIPYQECRNEEYEVAVSCGSEYQSKRDSGSIGVDTLIGATIGVVLGNQFHNHSDAAKVIGGVGGAIMANKMRENRGNNYPKCYETRVRKKCTTQYERQSEERVVSYKNCGTIEGKKICKRTHRKLDQFRVNITTN